MRTYGILSILALVILLFPARIASAGELFVDVFFEEVIHSRFLKSRYSRVAPLWMLRLLDWLFTPRWKTKRIDAYFLAEGEFRAVGSEDDEVQVDLEDNSPF